ncbi:MAG: VWA domain-containing protein [Alteromonadaceae bacterium]|nr:VWA domain-containing protein [Alteromonadaceae bacterium]
MRKLQRPPVEIFNLAFLDIITCAFGAVVLLILLAKNGDVDTEQGSADLSVLIQEVLSAQTFVEQLKGALSDKQEQLASAKAATAATTDETKNLQTSIPRAQKTIREMQDKAKSLRAEIRAQNARLNVPSSTSEPDEDVGGIPTDAEFVIFVIDSSGSMSQGGKWNKVMNVVSDILNNHPKMKGFQIMNADGDYLYGTQAGRWLNDSPNMRQQAIARMRSFPGGGSNPELGMLEALKRYKNQPGKVSMYVFGDDYSTSGLDAVVRNITAANKDSGGDPKFRIHGVGFYFANNNNARGFATFMQAVAKRNRGAFIGLHL